MEISKSTRHQKVIGDYGERIICNWLSRSGFEVTIVDHTGIDILAYNRSSKKRLGITIKSRTRNVGTEKTHVVLFRENDRQKMLYACEAFACEPWIGIYVETSSFGDLYLTSLEHYDCNYGGANWHMRGRYIERYEKDPNVKHIHFEFIATNWWKEG